MHIHVHVQVQTKPSMGTLYNIVATGNCTNLSIITCSRHAPGHVYMTGQLL